MTHEIEHLGIIPDGNRRYAKEYGCSKEGAYGKGAETMENLLDFFLDRDIDYLSVYALSKDNYQKRDEEELEFLFKLYHQEFEKLLDSDKLEENKVEVKFLGDWEEIEDKELKELIAKLEDQTYGYNGKRVVILFNYDTHYNPKQDERERKLCPPLDFLVRTSGCTRVSGFLRTRLRYAEIYWEAKNFPACDEEDFEIWINYYESRQRRYGGN